MNPVVLPSRDVRLSYAGDLEGGKGRVEVYHEGEWGTVCNDGISGDNAKKVIQVICKQLGYTSGVVFATGEDKRQRGAGTIWMQKVVCSGEEKNLFDCEFKWSYDYNTCWHYEDFSVDCD